VTDKKRRLVDESDRLLAALDEIRTMEAQKRDEHISTAEFHALAERIHDKSREIFQITGDQERLGDETPTSDESINDIEERA
jgi:hypothetical protein